MAGRVFGFENPDRFVAGAIGQPGSRIFYLQAREGGRITSVALEKVQVALLAERLTELMREVRSRGADIPDELPAAPDQKPLEEPIVETFRVGTMAIVWDGDDETIVVEAREIGEDDDAGDPDEAAVEGGDEPDLVGLDPVLDDSLLADFIKRRRQFCGPKCHDCTLFTKRLCL